MKKWQKKAVASVSCLNSHNLSAEELEEAVDWKNDVQISFVRPKGWKKSWDRAGLEKLVNSAKEYYKEKTGLNLPYNLAVHGPWVGHANECKLYEGDRFGSSSAEEMVEVAARFSSWLRIIADKKLAGLQRILEKNLDYGMNAKGTNINPYQLLNVWNSPRTAENVFWKAYKRAWQILEPFGLRPAWQSVGRVMTSTNVSHRVGKMAFAIAADTVNHYCGGGLTGSSVEILTKARGIGVLLRDSYYSERRERIKYASWAVSRVEDNEFASIGEALLRAVVRLVNFGDGIVVDLWRVKKHPRGMMEIPLAFTRGWGESFFIFAGQTVREHSPEVAWQKFRASELLKQRYGVDVLDEQHQLYSGSFFSSVRRAVRWHLNKKFKRGFANPNPLPISAFKGLKEHPASDQMQSWAFDRIVEGEFRNYKEAIKASTRLEADYTDGVELYLDPKTSQTIHRVECTLGWDEEGDRQFVCRQFGTGRTYHVSINWQTAIGANEPWKAVKAAIKAWRKQSNMEKKNQKIFSVLQPENASILVWFQDSLDSGNCVSGTRGWSERHGFNGDMFVSAKKLLRFVDDPRVFRVLQVAAEKVAKLKIAV